jgi:hypothetical protein
MGLSSVIKQIFLCIKRSYMTSTNCFRNCNTVVNAKSLFFPRLFSRSKTTLDTVKHQFRFKPVFRRRQALIGDKEAPS